MIDYNKPSLMTKDLASKAKTFGKGLKTKSKTFTNVVNFSLS